jgi:hypothetical protein
MASRLTYKRACIFSIVYKLFCVAWCRMQGKLLQDVKIEIFLVYLNLQSQCFRGGQGEYGNLGQDNQPCVRESKTMLSI